MIKSRIRHIAITLTIATATLLPIAQAQTNAARAAIESANAPVEAECQMLAERMKELDQLEQNRLMECGTTYETKRPFKNQEWIHQQRIDIQTKMFFAKC
jgi:hypothetical protein